MTPKYHHYNLKRKSVIKPYDGLLSAYLIESMGSSDALEMDNNERQAALYLLSDTTRAIIEKVEASVNELHIINKAEDIDSVGEYDATEAERLENLLVPAE